MTLVSELVWIGLINQLDLVIGLKTAVVSCIVSLHDGTNDGTPVAKMDTTQAMLAKMNAKMKAW
jgi:hypothetical protein